MKSWRANQLYFIGIFFPVILVSVRSAPGVTAQAVLAEMQSRYEKTNDLEAGFLQEYIGKVMMKSQKGEGKVYFKKKGMMRWDYKVPNQKLVSNGHTLWYYQPEEIRSLSPTWQKSSGKERLAFLAGEGELSGISM